MVKARRLLPDPEENAAAWLLALLDVDVAALSLQDLRSILVDIRTLARVQIGDQGRAFPRWEIVPDGSPAPKTSTPEYWVEWSVRQRLTWYQGDINKAIKALVRDGRHTVWFRTGFTNPIGFEIGKGASQPTVMIKDGTIEEVRHAFEFRLLFLLHESADRFGVCPPCSRIFLKERSTKVHCSNHCATIERVREWRIKQREKRAKEKLAKPKGGKHGAKKRKG